MVVCVNIFRSLIMTKTRCYTHTDVEYMTPETLYANQTSSLNMGSPVFWSHLQQMFLSKLLEEASSFRGWQSHRVSPYWLGGFVVFSMHPLLQARTSCHIASWRVLRSALPKKGFYSGHVMLIVILHTLRQPFPCQLLLSTCWGPCDIRRKPPPTDTFFQKRHSG